MSERSQIPQRGYQDETAAARTEGAGAAASAAGARARASCCRTQRGPKTPNLMAAHEVFRCARCGNLLSLPVGRRDSCSKCGVDLHSCVQCVSFDTSARWECTQSAELAGARRAEGRAQHLRAVRAAHDGRAADQHAAAGSSSSGPTNSARKAFDDLFK